MTQPTTPASDAQRPVETRRGGGWTQTPDEPQRATSVELTSSVISASVDEVDATAIVALANGMVWVVDVDQAPRVGDRVTVTYAPVGPETAA